MKIICSKKEFAKVMRTCEKLSSDMSYGSGCGKCVLGDFCGGTELEDYVEIEEAGHGQMGEDSRPAAGE